MNKQQQRICPWVTLTDPVYVAYHDTEWGRPVYDSQELFEKLCLDGQQAGLSWITILKKKQGYRDAFCQFDPYRIVKLSPEYLEKQLNNTEIVRNRLKVQSIVKNAKGYVAMEQEGISFSEFLWSFVGGQPIVNQYVDMSEVPTQTIESQAMSKALKQRGFNFVGPTICYAFMEAVGMVNDHLINCHCYSECVDLAK